MFLHATSFPVGLRHSLYWRIAAIFLLALSLLALAHIAITVSVSKRYFDETTQRLHANVAAHMLIEVSPFEGDSVNKEALGKIMHSMMAVNPSLEVYLLDEQGKILSYVVLEKEVKLNYVSIEPVLQFIREKGASLVYGDDPCNPLEKKIFSATAVMDSAGNLQGYVYMVLASKKYATASEALKGTYLMQMGLQSIVLTLLGAFTISLLILWLLMRNLNSIIRVAKQLEDGDLSARVPVYSRNELGRLATTINGMSETILRNLEEIKEVDKLRRELIANLSHDIRTPISIIHGYIETLIIKEGSLEAHKRKEYLQVILKSSERLRKLMDDLFELSKLEAGQIIPHKETFLMSDLLQDVMMKYKLPAQERNIHMETDIVSGAPKVCADVALIERVLQNLIDNALKFTPEHGKVRVSLRKENASVEVSIANTGEGIAGEEIPHIFNRYYKVEKSDHEKNNGSGLGLAIVKNILQIHETDIHVASERFGLTTFKFALPAL